MLVKWEGEILPIPSKEKKKKKKKKKIYIIIIIIINTYIYIYIYINKSTDVHLLKWYSGTVNKLLKKLL